VGSRHAAFDELRRDKVVNPHPAPRNPQYGQIRSDRQKIKSQNSSTKLQINLKIQ